MLYQEKQPLQPGEQKKRGEPEICPDCKGLGYKGRIAIYEILVIDDKLKQALLKAPECWRHSKSWPAPPAIAHCRKKASCSWRSGQRRWPNCNGCSNNSSDAFLFLLLILLATAAGVWFQGLWSAAVTLVNLMLGDGDRDELL